MNKTRFKWRLAALAILALTACGEDQDDLLVAQVGNRQITQTQLRTFVDGLTDGHRSRRQGQEARREYLQSLIDENLMWLEIEARGLDTSTVALLPLQRKVRNQLVTIYQEREKLTQVSITPDEVKEILQRRGLNLQKERLAWGIMTAAEAEIKAAIAKLEAGEVFEEVARRYSIAPQAPLGGELGFIGLEAAQKMGIPDSIFHRLPAGEITDYLPHSKGFFVVRFTDERPVDITQSEKAVFEELKGQKIGDNIRAKAEQLAQEFNWRINPPGLALLLQQGKETLDLEALSATTPLYTFDGGQVSLADFAYALKARKYQSIPADSAAVAALAERVLMAPMLLEAAARAAGLDQQPNFAKWEKNQRTLGLLQALRRIEVEESVAVSEEEMRQYYQEHEQLYYGRDRLKVGEVLLATEEEALQIHQQVEAGADIVELAKTHSLRPEARRENAVLGKYPSSELAPHIMKAEIDQLVGPIQVKGGYSVFKLLSREKGDLQPFKQVRRQIDDTLRNQKELERFEQFIAGLRQRYADQVQIYEDRLALALPDEYLSQF